MKIVLQKFIADSGLCSRRQAEQLIREGKVLVNNKEAELGMKADTDDEVVVDGQAINTAPDKIYIKLNKPKGYTCTNRKFKHEKNIFDLVDVKDRLFAVGRLDKDSRGLVLLTNDGELTQKLTHPRFQHEKEYVIQLKSKEFPPNEKWFKDERVESIIKIFEKGIDIGEGDGVVIANEIAYVGDYKFKMVLTQGKKRQLRRMFKLLGYDILDLTRVRIGKVELGNLKEGKWERVSSYNA